MENNDTGVAESVFIGGMFVLYGKQYASLCRYAGLDNEATEVEAAAAEMEAAPCPANFFLYFLYF